MIEDEIPEVAQAKRLGHRLGGIRGIYSHVSTALEQRIVDAFQQRWQASANPQAADPATQPATTPGNQPAATSDDPPQPPDHQTDPHADDGDTVPDADATPEAA